MSDIVEAFYDGSGDFGRLNVDPTSELAELTGFDTSMYETIRVLEDEHGLGVVPRNLNSMHAYTAAVEKMEGDVTEGAQGASILLHGEFAVLNVEGGSGDDDFDARDVASGQIELAGDAGDDTLHGGAASVLMSGDEGDDVLVGGSGNDTLLGGNGNDHIDGGAGVDLADLSLSSTRLVVDLNKAVDNAKGEGVDTLVNVEQIYGASFHNNQLTGDAADNLLMGGIDHNKIHGEDGDDVLKGIGSKDHLFGDAGADTLIAKGGDERLAGGSGVDTFQFDKADGLHAVIVDFESGEKIDLSGIDAIASTDGDDAFHLVDHLSGAAGEAALVVHAHQGYSLLELDVDGGGADAIIRIHGVPTAGDLVL